MNRRSALVLMLLPLMGVVALVGCTQQPTTSAPSETDSSATEPGDATLLEGLAKLSDADRAAALQQDVCPVGGGKLGSMGAPPKVTVEGQEVFLCCDGCEEDLRKDPAKYLAKLKAK